MATTPAAISIDRLRAVHAPTRHPLPATTLQESAGRARGGTQHGIVLRLRLQLTDRGRLSSQVAGLDDVESLEQEEEGLGVRVAARALAQLGPVDLLAQRARGLKQR